MKKVKNPSDLDIEEAMYVRAAYVEGWEAFETGRDVNSNPYCNGNEYRVYWFNGWYDRRYTEKYPDWKCDYDLVALPIRRSAS
jgi:ribosome modulation factor